MNFLQNFDYFIKLFFLFKKLAMYLKTAKTGLSSDCVLVCIFISFQPEGFLLFSVSRNKLMTFSSSEETESENKHTHKPKRNTHISTHAVFVVHFAFLGVEVVIRRAAVLLTRRPQAVGRRHRVILPTTHNQTTLVSSYF